MQSRALAELNARQAAGRPTSGKGGGGGAAESTPTAAAKTLSRLVVPEDALEPDEISPLSKFKDFCAVDRLGQGAAASAAPLPPPPPAAVKAQPAERIQSATVAADAAQLVQALLALVGAGTPDASLERCVAQLDPEVLSLLPDGELAQLLAGLAPLLRWSTARRQWDVPCVGAALPALQAACQERLERTSVPCDPALATAAARFAMRAVREGGDAAVSDGLLHAVAQHASQHCRQLGSEALASLLALLAAARSQPPSPRDFGNRVTECLLRLNQGAAGATASGLPLAHLADVVEALAQLRCVDGLSAAPVVNLSAARSRTLEAGAALKAGELVQLARVISSVAVIAATTKVQPSILLMASSAWHLLVVRAEALAERAATNNQLAGPTAACLSKMWNASALLHTVTKATSPSGFRLPDHLGEAAQASWLAQEQRLAWGNTSAQRRVLAALQELKVPPSCITTNRCCLDCVPIPVAVRLREAAGPGGARRQRRVAILLRDPLRQLMRGSGAALGAGEAQALLLKAAGWHVIPLDSHTALQLPRALLADELGALLMGDPGRSSLRFAA